MATRSPVYDTTPSIREIQTKILEAQDVQRQWREYQLALEETLKVALENAGIALPTKGSAHLELLTATNSITRKWEQALLVEVLSEHPEMIGSTFKCVYEPVSNTGIDSLVASKTELGRAIAKCFTDKQAKTNFKKRS